MKAISSAAAAIFFATISITLVGTTYFFSSTLTEKAMAETFEVIDIYNNRVIVRNTGTQPIEKLKTLVDGVEIPNEMNTIQPKTVETVNLILDGVTEGRHELIIISESMSQRLMWEVKYVEVTTTILTGEAPPTTFTTTTIPSELDIHTETEQGRAEIGKPVKWTGKIVLNNPSSTDIEDYTINVAIPEDAEKIIIKDSKKRVLFKEKTSWIVKIAGNANISYSFEFETPVPYKEENVIEPFIFGEKYRKKITVKSHFIGHYENVKAYTDIPEEVSENGFRIKLYQTKGKSRIDITSFPQYNVSLLDLNHNDIIDRIEWIVPVLSEQTFEVGAGVDKWAYEGPGANDAPPPDLSGIEFTSYTEIASSNDVRYTTTGGSAKNNPFHHFEFIISESVPSINQLDFYWEGYGDAGLSSLYVWNFNSDTWELLGSHSNTAVDGIVTASKTSGFSSYINASGFLELVVVDVTNKPNFISTDFVYVNITSTGPPTTPTSIECDGSTNCDITVNLGVDLNASGSTDPDGDLITYFIEALLKDVTVTNDLESGTIQKIASGGSPTIVTLHETSFESGNDATEGYQDDTANDWDWGEQQPRTGSYAPHVDGKATDARYTYSSSHDISSYEWCNIDVYFRIEANWDNNEYICLDYSTDGGTSWNQDTGHSSSLCVAQNYGTDDNVYHKISYTESDTSGDTGFKWRFRSTVSGVPEDGWVDDINVTCQLPGSADEEANTGWTSYEDVDSDYNIVNEIKLKIEVDSYNPEASVQKSNNKPDLELEMFDGSDWVSLGSFNLPATYTGGSYDETNYNFTITTINPSILSAWQSSSNQDIRIRGINMDWYDGTTIDEIKYINIWVTIDGKKWKYIGSHDETSTFYWDTSSIEEQTCVDLRANASDLTGSGIFSDYFRKYCCLNISHEECVISIGISEELARGIFYPSVRPIDYNVSAVNNTNSMGDTNYFVVISSSTCKVDLWMKADKDLRDNFGHFMRIENSTFDEGSLSRNDTSCIECPNITQSRQMSLSYQNIGNNLPEGTTVYLRYWICPYYCPGGPSVPPNPYNTTISIVGREAGSGHP